MRKSYLYKLCIGLLIFLSSTLTQNIKSQNLIISEIMAINNSVLPDEDGDYSDWIEIHNQSSESVNLNGWFLTDNPLNVSKWKFPVVSIDAGGYLVVYASEKNKTIATGRIHTNFKLSGSGEYLALIEPDSVSIAFSFDPGFPAQQKDVSYGTYEGYYILMSEPTPGSENSSSGNVIAPIFSHNRGFYASSFDVSLSDVNSNAEIYYTTDGSEPSLGNGTKYSTPININKTTVLSAICIESSTESALVTQTYLFANDILKQPASPSGYPTEWGSGFPADFEMDPEICTPQNEEKIRTALKSLPTVSIVTNIDHIFSLSDDPNTGGIYTNTLKTEDEWERPVSMEYFDPAQQLGFQINCGLRLHGGNSRKPYNSPKHSFRVSFRSKYGSSKLNFNLFEEKSAVNEFNNLVLRSGYNYSWVKNSPAQCEGTDYIKDPFAKKTQLDMNRLGAHTKFVHLYLNGLYWGVYNLSEKISDDFAENYLGGNEDDYDVVKDHFGLTDGTRDAWENLIATISEKEFGTNPDYMKLQGKDEDGNPNITYKNLIDIRNISDYMLLNFYMGNKDWDRNNWLATRNRVTNEHGFKFLSWDTETSMVELEDNITKLNNVGNPSDILTRLRENEEFRVYFADRIYKHFFNEGDLTSSKTDKRYADIAKTIEKAVIAESARWGDYRRDVDPGAGKYELYTVEHWNKQVNSMKNTYLPQRSDIVLNQLIKAEMYPDIEAPLFSHDGGSYDTVVNLSMTSNVDDIYYTTDNTDPRETGGEIALNSAFKYDEPLALYNDITIKARAKSGNQWSAMSKIKLKISVAVDIPLISNNISVTHGCYPNPVNDFTNIYFTLPVDGNVSVNIFNINGQITESIHNGYLPIGKQSFKWILNNTSKGIYFYQIKSEMGCYTGKLVVN